MIRAVRVFRPVFAAWFPLNATARCRTTCILDRFSGRADPHHNTHSRRRARRAIYGIKNGASSLTYPIVRRLTLRAHEINGSTSCRNTVFTRSTRRAGAVPRATSARDRHAVQRFTAHRNFRVVDREAGFTSGRAGEVQLGSAGQRIAVVPVGAEFTELPSHGGRGSPVSLILRACRAARARRVVHDAPYVIGSTSSWSLRTRRPPAPLYRLVKRAALVLARGHIASNFPRHLRRLLHGQPGAAARRTVSLHDAAERAADPFSSPPSRRPRAVTNPMLSPRRDRGRRRAPRPSPTNASSNLAVPATRPVPDSDEVKYDSRAELFRLTNAGRRMMKGPLFQISKSEISNRPYFIIRLPAPAVSRRFFFPPGCRIMKPSDFSFLAHPSDIFLSPDESA